MKEKIIKVIIYILLVIYIIPFIYFMCYFNWEYAKKNGFVSWLCFGEVVATAKSIIWPYYVFLNKESNEIEVINKNDLDSIDHFKNSRINSDSALLLIRTSSIIGDSLEFQNITPYDKKQIINLLNTAIKEAKLVNNDLLDKIHPELPEKYTKNYIIGLEMIRVGINNNERNKLLVGYNNLGYYILWSQSNEEDFFKNYKQNILYEEIQE